MTRTMETKRTEQGGKLLLQVAQLAMVAMELRVAWSAFFAADPQDTCGDGRLGSKS